ncbi:MAG: Ku protein [Firmicutes bacterium]|nr:Ku protein [Bacillota bacterium]
MKTSITFGLVYIPVALSLSAKVDEISFNQLDKKTKSRIRYNKTCDECDGKKVETDDIIKAYQYQKDKYVVFEEEDFDKLKQESDKDITIDNFANLDEIDPAYYDKHYNVDHDGNEKGFALLLHLLENENKVAVAKSILGNKEKLIVLRAKSGKMLLSTLFFHNELVASKAKEITAKPTSKELELGKTLLQNMIAPFEPEKYKDEYKQRVKDAIEKKIAGKLIKTEKKGKEKTVADLMEALTQSVKDGRFKPSSRDLPKTKSHLKQPTQKNDNSHGSKKTKTNAISSSKKSVQQRRLAVRAKA